MTPSPDDGDDTSGGRRAIFWCGAGFAAVGVAGLMLVPAGTWIWIVLIVIALTAIPQGFVSTRKPRGRLRR